MCGVKNMKLIILMGMIGLLVACGSAPKHANEGKVKTTELDRFMQGKPAAYRPYFDVYLKQGQRNSVLNEMRIGLYAFENGDFELSGWLFDRAIGKIETIYANNKTAEKARSKFKQESTKDFKGEPYERAMAYFYRGLIYLQQDDYENARASMLGGLLQDSLAEHETYEQDFASHFYIAGWASRCNGNASQAEDYFREAIKLNDTLSKPQSKENVLVLVTSGSSPLKFRLGENNELLAFDSSAIESVRNITKPRLKLNRKEVHFVIAENLHWQAATRGGRTIDVINNGKAQFKENTDALGNALTSTGSGLMNAAQASNNQNLGKAGAVMAVFGLVSKGISKATRAEADIRYWDNLPAFIYTATVDKTNLGSKSAKFQFTDFLQQNPRNQTSQLLNRVENSLDPNRSCDLVVMNDKYQPLALRHINQ